MVLLCALAALAALWIIVPAVAFGLGFTRLRGKVYDAPNLAIPPEGDGDYARRYQQFAELGFRPVGMVIQKAWFINPVQWRWRSLQGTRWMIGAEEGMFASFFRLDAAEPVRFAVVTTFDGGGMAQTACPTSGAKWIPTHDFSRMEVDDRDPAELVTIHKKHLEELQRERGLKAQSATLSVVAAEDVALSLAAIRQLGGKDGYEFIFNYFLIPSALSFVILWQADVSWIWPGSVLLGATAFAAARLLMLPRIHRRNVLQSRSATPSIP